MEGQLPGGCPSISIVICRLQSPAIVPNAGLAGWDSEWYT